jgi:hypothetical protein
LGKKRLFWVTKGDTIRWMWAVGSYNALAQTARADGYTSGLAGKETTVTKEAVAAKLATFTDDELAALGLSRKKGGKK